MGAASKKVVTFVIFKLIYYVKKSFFLKAASMIVRFVRESHKWVFLITIAWIDSPFHKFEKTKS